MTVMIAHLNDDLESNKGIIRSDKIDDLYRIEHRLIYHEPLLQMINLTFGITLCPKMNG